MINTVAHGRAGTAMQPFSGKLSPEEIEAVVVFVIRAFIEGTVSNTRYHTPENGWDDHERYRDAFPFALGVLALDTPDVALSQTERRGKRLFMTSCITCHDHGMLHDDRTLWEPRAVSFPRGGYSHREKQAPDTETGATPYARHEQAPILVEPTPGEQRGEALFQENCAFCHAPDGTGRHWIGSFLEPRPRDLTDAGPMRDITSMQLRKAIGDGIAGSSMPAWKTVFDERQIDDVADYVEKAFLRRQ